MDVSLKDLGANEKSMETVYGFIAGTGNFIATNYTEP